VLSQLSRLLVTRLQRTTSRFRTTRLHQLRLTVHLHHH